MNFSKKTIAILLVIGIVLSATVAIAGAGKVRLTSTQQTAVKTVNKAADDIKSDITKTSLGDSKTDIANIAGSVNTIKSLETVKGDVGQDAKNVVSDYKALATASATLPNNAANRAKEATLAKTLDTAIDDLSSDVSR